MTKKLSILCAAVVLLAACSQKEELRLLPNDNAIEFSAYSASSVVTRGSVVQPTAIQGADKGIGIFAFYQEERTGDFNTYVHKEPGFMYNQRVTTSDNGATWSYTPTKYWPNNDGDKISFFAYAPYDADKTWESFGFKTDINGQTMTVRFPILQEAADQIDHIFATPQLNLTKQAVDVNGTNYATGTNNVMFDFKHITSQVNIYVGVEQSSASQQATPWTDTHTEIVVNSIQLKSRSTAMTLNYDISSGKAVAQPTTFASDKQAITLNIDNFIPTAATINTTNYCADSLLAADANNFKQLNKANSVLFLAPEALGEVVVTYTTTTTDGVHSLNSTVVPNTVTQSLSNITLEPGRSYRLNLLIGMNTVTVNAIPCAWTTPGFEEKVDVPAKTPELQISKAGEPTIYTSLAAFRDSVNAGNSYEGYTITLLKDINLKNVEWTPISNYAYGQGSDKLFAGTFDGGNHTIRNLKVSANTQDALGNTSDLTNGFFGQVATCTIKNVKFVNANVSGAGLNAIVASLHTVSTGKLLMKNVQVLSGSVTNTSNAGGLMCFVSGWAGYEDCVNYASVSGYGTGGIVGMLRDDSGTNTCTIENCTNYGIITNTVGGGDGAGGIVSKINNSGSITNCKNYGAVSGTVGNVYAGGIIGLANPNSKTFTISDCINYADVSSNAGDFGRAGGILGSFGGSLTISRCINTGDITGYQGAGGINGWNGDSWGLVDEYCYNSGAVTCSNGTNAGGIEQGNSNQTVKYSLNKGSVTCTAGTAWQISNSSSTITLCYYYDGATLKDNSGTAVGDIDAAVAALNTGLSTPFWGKDGGVIKPVALITP